MSPTNLPPGGRGGNTARRTIPTLPREVLAALPAGAAERTVALAALSLSCPELRPAIIEELGRLSSAMAAHVETLRELRRAV